MLTNKKPNTILNAVGVTTNQTSDPIRPRNGSFALDIRVNGGSGTQTLTGTFKLRAKNDERSHVAFIDVTDYAFPSGPAGSAWNFFGTFDGNWGAVYQLVFTVSSGQGDIVATINFPE